MVALFPSLLKCIVKCILVVFDVQVITAQRVVTLGSPTRSEMDEWIEALKFATEDEEDVHLDGDEAEDEEQDPDSSEHDEVLSYNIGITVYVKLT